MLTFRLESGFLCAVVSKVLGVVGDLDVEGLSDPLSSIGGLSAGLKGLGVGFCEVASAPWLISWGPGSRSEFSCEFVCGCMLLAISSRNSCTRVWKSGCAVKLASRSGEGDNWLILMGGAIHAARA